MYTVALPTMRGAYSRADLMADTLVAEWRKDPIEEQRAAVAESMEA